MEVTSLFNQPVRNSFLKLIFHQSNIFGIGDPCFSKTRESTINSRPMFKDISLIEGSIISTGFIIKSLVYNKKDHCLHLRANAGYVFDFKRTNTDIFIIGNFRTGDRTRITRRCYLLSSLTRD